MAAPDSAERTQSGARLPAEAPGYRASPAGPCASSAPGHRASPVPEYRASPAPWYRASTAPGYRASPARTCASPAPAPAPYAGAPAALDDVQCLGPEGFWRPWLQAPGHREERAPRHATEAITTDPEMTEATGKVSQYQHPVRLFWPKSKCYDYLYQEAEILLKNFPVQATISVYEDSDSEDESEKLSCESQYN